MLHVSLASHNNSMAKGKACVRGICHGSLSEAAEKSLCQQRFNFHGKNGPREKGSKLPRSLPCAAMQNKIKYSSTKSSPSLDGSTSLCPARLVDIHGLRFSFVFDRCPSSQPAVELFSSFYAPSSFLVLEFSLQPRPCTPGVRFRMLHRHNGTSSEKGKAIIAGANLD